MRIYNLCPDIYEMIEPKICDSIEIKMAIFTVFYWNVDACRYADSEHERYKICV